MSLLDTLVQANIARDEIRPLASSLRHEYESIRQELINRMGPGEFVSSDPAPPEPVIEASSLRPLPRIDGLGEAPVIENVRPVSDVAKRAQDVLGYRGALNDEERRVHKLTEPQRRYADETKLFEACVACGIRPFQAAAVEEYKQVALAEARASDPMASPEAFRRAMISMSRYAEYRWERSSLGGAEQFDGIVPEGVLAVALDLKEKLPEVTFEVDALRRNVIVDPFLIARYGLAEFYVAVWDEPGFDAKFE